MITSHNNYLKLAFENAKVNLGKTKMNPSVGCIVVKNGSVISSGRTSISGRPHAEYNALIVNKNFKYSDLYLTLEPCTHYGKTPPCTDLIVKKGIKRVFISFYDVDERTAKLAKKKLNNKKVKVYKKANRKFANFYQSYFLNRIKSEPLIDAKIAVSKDYYTISKSKKWITNIFSRKRAHLIRSEYDAIMSTSKSINVDNSLLNCRLNGLNQNKPDLFIIDLNLKLKKNLKLFKNSKKRKIFLITMTKSSKKISYLKRKGIKIIFVKRLLTRNDFLNLFKILKKIGYNRILVESGLIFLNTLLKFRLIFNFFIFKSSKYLKNNGINSSTIYYIKKLILNKRIKVNLDKDKLYKVKIKNV